MNKILKIIKKIKIKNLIFLVLLLMFNAYAWFIYIAKVQTGLSVHVSSWNVEFTVGDQAVTNINVDIENAYPGMDDFEKNVIVHNKGEKEIELSYEITSFTVMGTTYTVGNGYTAEDIEEQLSEDYPFNISIEIEYGTDEDDSTVIGEFKIKMTWDYESGDDEEDTRWGSDAYEFYATNPGDSFINLNIDLIASQRN